MTPAEEPAIAVFVKTGDPASETVVRYLDQRGLKYTKRDVLTDPSATAILFGRLGRVTVPVVQVGDRLLVAPDPVQLARFLPRDEDGTPAVAFGVAVRTVTREIAAEKKLPAPFGVEVGSVKEGSPAQVAGIQPGDVITGIGAYTLNGGADQFRRAISARRPGDRMTLTVWRDGESVEVTVEFPVEAAIGDQAVGDQAVGDQPAAG
jgi:membrane-associated protease RseP (regulator of RpoE activity)